MEHPKPTNATIYKLYASSQTCAYPGCEQRHIGIDQFTGAKICNTQVCHISARSENGPRWDPDQTSEANRNDSNLILLCRKHHAYVDDPNNLSHYTADLLRTWKQEQEKQPDQELQDSDIEAVERANITLIANAINLGGQGGQAPGAGGGGGGAIGPKSRGGAGGTGGHFRQNGQRIDPSTLQRWESILSRSQAGPPPGAGGGGAPAQGESSQAGRGGDGGDMHVQESVRMPAATYRISVGRAGRLPGEIGGSTYIEGRDGDGNISFTSPIARGGLSGDSHLPDGAQEVTAEDIDRGFRVNCLAVCDDARIVGGVFSIDRLGWSYLRVTEFPTDLVLRVIVLVTKPPEMGTGFYVSLFCDNQERSRRAVHFGTSTEKHISMSNVLLIGAEVTSPGMVHLVAHSQGIRLCETAIELRTT